MHTKAEIPTESPINDQKFDKWGAALNLGVKIPDKYGATEVNARLGGYFGGEGAVSFGVSRYF